MLAGKLLEMDGQRISSGSGGTTAVLLHFDGTNGSTVITDQNSSNTWTAGTGTALSTAQAKFGPSSIFVPASTSGAGFTAPMSFAAGTGDFTIEMFVYSTSVKNAQYLMDYGTESSQRLSLFWSSNGGPVATYDGAYHYGVTIVTANAWHHVALARQSGTMRLFLDGNLEVSYSDTRNLTKTSTSWFFGRDDTADAVDSAGCYIDELRCTLGLARYTANFTPPTAPFSYP